jgi:hypothetical protein
MLRMHMTFDAGCMFQSPFQSPLIFNLPEKDEDHPGIRNTTLFALGIVLLELCLGQTLESMTEAGNRYGDVARRCIYCEFDSRDTNLNNERFREAVYQGVVAPLEDIFNDFDQPYEMSGQPF